MPHIIHYMAGYKPWNPGRFSLRNRQPFYWLWHAIDAAAVSEINSATPR